VRPLVFGYGLAFYVWKTLWPLGLISLYEIPVRWTPLEWRFVIGSVAALAISAGVLVARRSWPAPLAAWAAAVVLVSPVSGLLVHNGPQIAADRYTYLPAIPLSLLVGGGVCVLARAVSRGTVAPGNARMIAVGLAIWLLGFGALTWQQAEVWQDSVSMWSHAVTFAPNCARCQHGLGSALHNHGAPHVALPHFQRAVALRPDMVDFRIPLGISLLEAGRGAEALPHLEKAVAHFDKNPKLHRHLGAALLSAGRPDDARREFEAALAVRADDRDALTGVGLALVDANRPGDSLPFFEKALAGSTPAPYAHFGLARAYLALGDSGRAEREIAVLRTLDPRLAARAAKR
jgi:Flp pilus assembly protein TadD